MKNSNAVALGKIKSAKKAKTSAENGKKGGRPKKVRACECPDCTIRQRRGENPIHIPATL